MLNRIRNRFRDVPSNAKAPTSFGLRRVGRDVPGNFGNAFAANSPSVIRKRTAKMEKIRHRAFCRSSDPRTLHEGRRSTRIKVDPNTNIPPERAVCRQTLTPVA